MPNLKSRVMATNYAMPPVYRCGKQARSVSTSSSPALCALFGWPASAWPVLAGGVKILSQKVLAVFVRAKS